ncbi:MAG: molybdopterin converting factor subunit 1 [Chloroflexota bacterium]
MKTKVLFFATLKDRAGTRQLVLELPDRSTVRELKTALAGRLPGLLPGLETALIAVDREYAFDEDVIPADAEVAIFPPVSGG